MCPQINKSGSFSRGGSVSHHEHKSNIAIFRDVYWTEKLDYFSAALCIAISIFTCVARLTGTLSDTRTRLFGVVVVVVFGYHIGYMSLIKFDYGYNMKFMVVIGFVNVVCWLWWCAMNRKNR